MRSLRLALILVAAAACGGDDDGPIDPDPTGPYDDLPLGQDLRFDGVTGTIHIARDQFGIAHIHAENTADLAFAQGYVSAHDRLPQMDILRRFGQGRVAELFGALEAGAVETDLEMRAHRMRPIAEEALAELRASADPMDQDIAASLDAYAAGVNAYADDVRAGKYQLDPGVLLSFDPERFAAWEPVDSVVLTRFQSFAVSFTAPLEVDLTDMYQTAVEVFDGADPQASPELAARAGAGTDLVRLTPIGRTATIDGFPNVDQDSGSRADGGGKRRSREVEVRRPRVPRHLLSAARRTFAAKLGLHKMLAPHTGSNNWAVAPDLAGGKALLAGDPHQPMPNPSVFYPVHLVVPGEIDMEGITFAGIPGVILGRNQDLAWMATVCFHDVNDVYLETIVPCDAGGGDCVEYDGGQVPVETWTEEVKIGALGTITETKTVTYERVAHHGTFIPTVVDRDLVPRTEPQALSIKYTGYDVTHELRAGYQLMRAASIPEAFAAFRDFEYGGQNWIFISADGHIGWTTMTKVPLRSPAAYRWDPVDAPDAVAPFFVMPGDGSAEWEGFLDPRYIPHAVDPAQGFLVSANSDPVGASFDGDGLNQPEVDGRPLYVGVIYDVGQRTERITELLEQRAGAGPLTLDDMIEIQLDTRSNYGARMQRHLTAAAAAIDSGSAPIDAWLLTLPPGRVDRLRAAGERLAGWTLATPPAVEGAPTPSEIADSTATSLFNVWMYFFLDASIGDELARIGWNVRDLPDAVTARTALALFEEPDTLRSGRAAATGEPILCDDLDTPELVEGCTLIALQSLDAAAEWLASDGGLGSPEMDDWRWGKLHTLTMKPLFPNDAMHVPPRDDPNPAWRRGAPRPGDNHAVDRGDPTWTDLDFTMNDEGASTRLVAEAEAGTLRVKFSLPGGTTFDRQSPHYRDLFDDYWMDGLYFDLPFSSAEIVAAGEERWRLRGPEQEE